MWYVYVLKSLHNNEFYKGLSDDLDRRIKDHLSGKEPSTKKMLPLELVHVEIYYSRAEARRVEKFLKSGFGREILKKLFT